MRKGNSLRSSDSWFLPARSVAEPCKDKSSAYCGIATTAVLLYDCLSGVSDVLQYLSDHLHSLNWNQI